MGIVGIAVIALGAALCALTFFVLGSAALRITLEARHVRARHDLSLEVLKTQVEILKQKQVDEREIGAHAWNGFRKFLVKQIKREAPSVASVLLVPHDGKPIPPFYPGQFLTFNLRIPGEGKNVVRCYSLSCAPNNESYRVTVKKIPPNPKVAGSKPGVSSTYINDLLAEGEILDVKAPSGSFFLDLHDRAPVVLIGGGIGVTPVFSMLEAIARRGDGREAWFFYGVRHSKEVVFAEDLKEIADKHDNVRVNLCFNEPQPEDQLGRDFQHKEHVSVDLLKRTLPSNNYEFFTCGPPPMMEAVTAGLKAWGVPDSRIHFEAFGFATVKKTAAVTKDESAAPAVKRKVKFARSNQSHDWTGEASSVLDLAEKCSIAISSACRSGNCGTCVVAIKSGEVDYLHAPGFKPEAGTCLACISVPKTDLELDA